MKAINPQSSWMSGGKSASYDRNNGNPGTVYNTSPNPVAPRPAGGPGFGGGGGTMYAGGDPNFNERTGMPTAVGPGMFEGNGTVRPMPVGGYNPGMFNRPMGSDQRTTVPGLVSSGGFGFGQNMAKWPMVGQPGSYWSMVHDARQRRRADLAGILKPPFIAPIFNT